MADHAYAGTQFPDDDDAFRLFHEGPPLEDFNGDFDLLGNGDSLPVWADFEHNLNNHLVNVFDFPLIGSHVEPADDFDFEFAMGGWEDHITIDFDEALSSIQDSQHLDEEPQATSHTITAPTLPSTCREDEPALLPKDEEPGASATNRASPNGSNAREPLHCPKRAADRELGVQPSCTDLNAKSMTEVRRHLQRPPHSLFVERCPTCNDNFLDEATFNRDHGQKGQHCNDVRSQPRGNRQVEQWSSLRDRLKECINLQQNVEQCLESPSIDPMNFDGLRSPRRSSSLEHDFHYENDQNLRQITDEQSSSSVQFVNQGRINTENPKSALTVTNYDQAFRSNPLSELPMGMYSGNSPHESKGCSVVSKLGSVSLSDYPSISRPYALSAPRSSNVSSETLSPVVTAQRPYSTVITETSASSHPGISVSTMTFHPETEIIELLNGAMAPYSHNLNHIAGMLEVPHTQQKNTKQLCDPLKHPRRSESPHAVRFQYNVEREGTTLEIPDSNEFLDGTPISHSEPRGSFYPPPESSESVSSQMSGPSSMSITSWSEPAVLSCDIPGCAVAFRGKFRRGNLARHVRRLHGGMSGDYQCKDPHCSRAFNRSDARLKHYRKHHPEFVVGRAIVRRPYWSGHSF